MKELVTITDRKAVTTSLIVAEAFEKQHQHVLRAIRNMECSDEFNRSNFGPVGYVDAKGQARPMYQITRDGFSFLAMGFTGRKAAEFKERFIAEFNRMEQALLEGAGETKRVDVNLKHTRGITNPQGLDIKYTLDLTKICLRPNRRGLQILERITGMDLCDIIPEDDFNTESPMANQLFGKWEDEHIISLDGEKTGATVLYNDFREWYQQTTGLPAPAQKWFGNEMARRHYRKVKRGGVVNYLDIALLSGEGLAIC